MKFSSAFFTVVKSCQWRWSEEKKRSVAWKIARIVEDDVKWDQFFTNRVTNLKRTSFGLWTLFLMLTPKIGDTQSSCKPVFCCSIAKCMSLVPRMIHKNCNSLYNFKSTRFSYISYTMFYLLVFSPSSEYFIAFYFYLSCKMLTLLRFNNYHSL